MDRNSTAKFVVWPLRMHHRHRGIWGREKLTIRRAWVLTIDTSGTNRVPNGNVRTIEVVRFASAKSVSDLGVASGDTLTTKHTGPTHRPPQPMAAIRRGEPDWGGVVPLFRPAINLDMAWWRN